MIGRKRDGGESGRRLYPGRRDMFLLSVLLLAVFSHAAFAQDPDGAFVQGGIAFGPSVGLQFGYVSAASFFTRELNLVASTNPFTREREVQVAATVGGAVRVFGIGRTIGNVNYRGFDLDLGLRIGPALSFRVGQEDRAFRNRRFNLFLEPFLRWSVHRWRRLLFAELGVHQPLLRLGLWWDLDPSR